MTLLFNGQAPTAAERKEWAEDLGFGFDGNGNPISFENPTSGDVISIYAPETGVAVTRTTTGTAHTGACEYRGFRVRAVTGTVNVTTYDNTSATGTPLQTITSVTLDSWHAAASGFGARNNTTGLHVVIAGGGTCTIDFYVEGV